MPDKKTFIPILLLTAYFAATFLIFLLLLFPFDRVKSKLEAEVRRLTPLEVSIARISPRFFNRFALSDVVVSDKNGRVLFESPNIKTTVSLFGFLRGLLAMDIKAAAYGGELQINAQQGKARQYVMLELNNLDLGSYPLLKDFGLRLSGKLGGNFEMTGDAGKGRLWIKGLTSRELKIKGFPIPDLDFEQCWFDADLKGDRLLIKKLEFDGKELKIRVTGDLVLRERGTLNLIVKLKASERLAREQAGILSLFKNKDSDGFYQFALGGMLTEPVPRL